MNGTHVPKRTSVFSFVLPLLSPTPHEVLEEKNLSTTVRATAPDYFVTPWRESVNNSNLERSLSGTKQ